MGNLGFNGVTIPDYARAAHAEILVKFEEGLDVDADVDLVALMELVDSQMQVDSSGIVLVPSKEFSFQSANGGMVDLFEPVLHGMPIATEQFGGLLRIGEADLRLDRYGAKAATMKEVGLKAAARPGDVVRASLNKLLTAKTLGGSNFFSQTQFIDPSKGAAGGLYANLYNLSLTDANYETVRAAMSARVDEGGTPRRTRPTHLIFSSSLRATAKKIVGLEFLPGTGSNPNYDPAIRLVEVEDLPSGAWMLGSNKGTVKPIGYHQSLKPRVMYFGTERNGLTMDHLWRADVEDTVIGVAPWKMSYSKPGIF